MKGLNEEKMIKFITIIIFSLIIVFVFKNNTFFSEKMIAFSKPEEVIEKKDYVVNGQKQSDILKNQEAHMLISPEEYKEKLESGEYVHLDIRTFREYNEEKISGGLNIDFYSRDFKNNLNALDKSKKYIYHCRSGSRSRMATHVFKELGFSEIYELEGGINNWKNFYQTIK